MKNCCAIILNWNNYHDTKECIESIMNSKEKVDDLIIVDNASVDGSTEKIRNEYDSIKIINNESNVGFAAGINVGIREALKSKYRFILLINNDAILSETCLSELISTLEISCKFGIAGPRIFYNSNKNIIWQGGGYFSFFTGGNVVPEKNKRVGKKNININKEVSFLTGCIMLIKSEVFSEIGFFNERIYFYEEDVDFCLRAIKRGFRLIYVPSAIAWHKVEGIKITNFAFYNRARSRIIVLRDNFNDSYFIYGLLMHFVYYTPYKLIQSLKKRTLGPFISWIQGTYDGLISSRKTIVA